MHQKIWLLVLTAMFVISPMVVGGTTTSCDASETACDDGDPCTIDSCDPATGGCSHKNKCDDGNPCNGVEECLNGECRPGIPVNCDDDDPCTTDSCDPATGDCTFKNKCNDNDPCTIDSCDPATGDCLHTPKCRRDSDRCYQYGCRNGYCTFDAICNWATEKCINNQCVPR